MPTWEQKRAAIAAALAGGNPPSVGAAPMVNPMISAMSPQAPGLIGAAPTQGEMMAQANASLAGAPGFDYVPPAVGPAPVATPAGPAAVGGPWNRDDRLGYITGRQTPANTNAYTMALGQGAYNYQPGGSGNNRQRGSSK